MIGIGFNAYIHDTAASLIRDGQTVAFVEEERLIREKHTTRFPERSIRYCLEQAEVSMKDVDFVAFYWDPYAGFFHRLGQTLKNLPHSLKPLFGHQLDNFRSLRNVEQIFRETFNYTGEFYFVNHYLAHAAHAAYRSPFKEASILVVDGNGEIGTTWLGKLNPDGKIQALREVRYPHSIGLVWCAITEYLGFTQNYDEGKVMGMAAYGDECLVEPFQEILRYKEDGTFEVDLSYFDYHLDRKRWFSQKFVDVFGPPRAKDDTIGMRHMSIARALQVCTQDILQKLVQDLVLKTKYRNLAYTGGVALNCVANGRLVQSELISDLFIPPAANDAGAAEGAALYVNHMIYGNRERHVYSSPYLGPGFDNEQIEQELINSGLPYYRSENIEADTAQLLVDGKIIGWFQGRMEAGPRALGHRSIIADPRPERMKEHLNARVKHREWFRPFAPSVLAEKADEVFATYNKESPYMLLAFDVLPHYRGKIPAIEHVDHTARVQTVTPETNPRYYKLIKEFEKLTDIPTILNTSFNVMGEPIVYSPKNAIDCFLSTGIDILVIGDFICEKKKA